MIIKCHDYNRAVFRAYISFLRLLTHDLKFCSFISVHTATEMLSACCINVVSKFFVLHLHLTGHIGIAVPDVHLACKLFEEKEVTFVKKPDDGEKAVHTPGVAAATQPFQDRLCLHR